jgi:transcriptional regulator NrdR family protein
MTKRRRECLDCGSRWKTYEVEADRLDLLEDAAKLRPNI